MSQRVLLVGATGRLGRHFVSALREQDHTVVALARNDSDGTGSDRRRLLESFSQDGVVLVDGNLEDEASLKRACQDADAVVSCIDHRPDHLRLQVNLAKAAARSGSVRRILPSQFGIDSRLYGNTRVDRGDLKRELQQTFATSGAAVTYVHTNGLASEWVGSLGQLGLSAPPTREVEVYGDGIVQFSTVAPEDAARYAVRALADSETVNKHVAIVPPDNLLTQHDLIDLWEDKAGVKLHRLVVSSQVLDERIGSLALNPAQRPQLAMVQLVRAAWIDGLGDGRRLPNVLELSQRYSDIRYQSAGEYLSRYHLH
jgi:uncharacterized protein YbjT (DUF2867 family)